MKHVKKTFLSLFAVCTLMLCTVFCAVNLSAHERPDDPTNRFDPENCSGECGDNLSWVINSDGELIISGTGAMWNWSSATNAPWYSNGSAVKAIIIEDGVESIGNCAFADSDKLESVTVAGSVAVIGESSFHSCTALTDVSLSYGIQRISEFAFYACDSLSSIVIPDSVTRVDRRSFASCKNLTEVTLSTALTSLGEDAFYNCSSLASITLPESITAIGNYTFQYCSSLTSINIPASVTAIGLNAFSSSGLKSITIPAGVTTIQSGAFAYCEALAKIEVDENNPHYSSDEAGVLFDKEKTELIQYPVGSSQTHYTVPDSVVTIQNYSFSKCSKLAKITIPESVTSFGFSVFFGCNDLVIRGCAGSAAEAYAVENSFTFESISDQPEPVLTASGECGDSLTWTLYANGELVIDGEGNMWNWTEEEEAPWHEYYEVIASVILSDGITSIGDRAFMNCMSLAHISIPDSVSSIGSFAFFSCICLDELTLPANLTVIGERAFRYANFTSIAIPEGVTSIPYGLFGDCQELTSVTLPSTVLDIQSCAFYGCGKLLSVNIPEAVSSIGEMAFYFCRSLKDLTILNPNTQFSNHVFLNTSSDFVLRGYADSTTEAYAAANGHNFETIPDQPELEITASGACGDSVTWTLYADGTLVFDGTGAMWDYASTDDIPYLEFVDNITSAVFNPGITYIGVRTLAYYCNVTSISIPDTVGTIGQGAFFECSSITSIVFPDSVTELGNAVLANCYNLENVTLPKNITEIPDNTFQNCFALRHLTIPDSVTTMGMAAIGWCYGLESITLSKNLTYIGPGAFIDCTSLTSITLPDSLRTMSFSAFANCSSLESVTIPNGVTEIGDYSFEFCVNLKTVFLPDSLTAIGEGMFYQCHALENVNIPETAESIGADAFRYCGSLQSLRIPASVTFIGEGAFTSCGNLQLELAEGQSSYCLDENGVLFNADKTVLLLFPDHTEIEDYVIPDGVLRIGANAFHDCNNLKTVSIPASLEEIGTTAFGATQFMKAYFVDENNPYFTTDGHGVLFTKDMTDLVQYPLAREDGSYTVPDSVINIRDEAFAYSLSLTYLTMGANVETIGVSAFHCCENLNDFALPDTVRHIDAYAFAECYGFTAMTLPESMEYLGEYAFYNCYNLTNVTVLSPEMEYGWDVFASVPAETFTLCGKADSTTQQYAEEYGLSFQIAESSFFPGDIDGDGTVDIADAIKLFQHTMLPALYPIDYAGDPDLTKDGAVDIADAIRLFQHSMLPDLYPIE